MEAILTNHTDFFPVGEKAKDLDWLYGAVFYTAVAAVIFIELEFWVEGQVKSFYSWLARFTAAISKVAGDFKSARYYKPWSPKQPIIVVSSKKQIQELSESSALSQRAVYADMFQFRRTMNNLNDQDNSMTRSRLFGRLLHVDGPRHLPGLMPYLRQRVTAALEGQMTSQGKQLQAGETAVPVASTARIIASRSMSLIFFGETLSSNPEFADALLQYPKDLVNIMITNMLTPKVLAPFVHELITRRGKAMLAIQSRVTAAMARPDEWDEDEEVKELTLVHNMSRLSAATNPDYWTPEMMSQALLGIWFAAAHQPWMNLDFIILELASRPEWQKLLREELKSQLADLNDYETLQSLPLLDGFIKETVRLSPLDTLAVRRKAMRDYTFKNGGIKCQKGATVCMSSYDAMHDEAHYNDPDSFEPRRFLDDASSDNTRFTDVSEKMPVWGFGSLACPGRHHASLVIKLAVVELVLNYNMRLENRSARLKWMWETFTMPYEKTRVILQKI